MVWWCRSVNVFGGCKMKTKNIHAYSGTFRRTPYETSTLCILHFLSPPLSLFLLILFSPSHTQTHIYTLLSVLLECTQAKYAHTGGVQCTTASSALNKPQYTQLHTQNTTLLLANHSSYIFYITRILFRFIQKVQYGKCCKYIEMNYIFGQTTATTNSLCHTERKI